MEVEVQTGKLNKGLDSYRQPVLQITLSGTALLLTIASLCLAVHFIHPSLLSMILAISPLPLFVLNDYRAFLSLGPGGTPSTFPGYIKICCLRLFALSDPFTPPPVLDPRAIRPPVGFFQQDASNLPERSGPRPIVDGIAPQRQRNQIGDKEVNLMFRAALRRLVQQYPDKLRTAVSCFEKKGLALFSLNPLNTTCNGEICHVHESDRAMHMNLHPADAAVVLERGWGQRHPLAKGGWLRHFVPREFVMVYAPRDVKELEVIFRIVAAGAWWVSGERFALAVPEREQDLKQSEEESGVRQVAQIPMETAEALRR